MTSRGALSVISFNTGGVYIAQAQRLAASAARFGVSLQMYTRPDRKKWWANVLHKQEIIIKALHASNAPILYVDADTEILGSLDPLLVALGTNDVLVLARSEAREKYNAGILLLANNARTRRFSHLWLDLARRYAHRFETADQALFVEAAKGSSLRIGDLPPEFNSPASANLPGARIIHHKVSRDDPSLAAWKECRRLEDVLCQRGAEMLRAPRRKEIFLVGAGISPQFSTGIEVHGVGCMAKAHACSWLSSCSLLPTATPNLCAVFLPTDHEEGNTAVWLRHHLQPKPNFQNPPPGIALYYPSFEPVNDFKRHELQGTSPWTAALNAARLRGFRNVSAACPDGHRNFLLKAAERMRLKLTLV